MSVLSDLSQRECRIVEPFIERTKIKGMSAGVGPASYDVRIAQDVTIRPGEFVLVSTVEYFRMPRFVCARVHDKSTWARLGLAAQNTFIDPGWEGFLTVELTNHNKPAPWWKFWKRDQGVITIKAGSPLVQIVFEFTDRLVGKHYGDLAGKYFGQGNNPVAPILEDEK